MSKKNKKKDLPANERSFGVILESMDSKLNFVVEAHKSLDATIHKNHEEFREFKREVNYKFETVFEKFEEIDTQFSNVKDELHIIRNELKEKVGRDEFVLLEKRVMALEKLKKN